MKKSRVEKKFGNTESKENIDSQNRKKKYSSNGQRRFSRLNTEKRKVTTWSLNRDEKEKIFSEMGCVKLISDDSSSEASSEGDHLELTPAVSENSVDRPAPMAPRVLLPSQRDNLLNSSSDSIDLTVNDSSPKSRKQCGQELSITDELKCNHFLELSDEIILLILRWLPKFTLTKCARVCHRWQRLVNDESLWRRLDLANKTLPPGSIGNVLNKGVQILRLAKAEIEGPIYKDFVGDFTTLRLSRLQYLDLSMSTTDAEVLTQLFAVCRDLRKLSLEHCILTDISCQYISENKDLEVLNLCMCQGITTSGVMSIVSNCTKLHSLNLGWTGLHRHTIVYLALCLPPNLSRLNLSGCRENITDEEVLQLCRTCSDLKELDLSDSTVLTCASVNYIVEFLTGLEYIALSRCYRIAPYSLLELKKMPLLLAVDIFGDLSEDTFRRLKEELKHLKLNKFPFSSIARPTTGVHRTSLWGLRVREST